MESCLGELHQNWCMIYLDDITVFSCTPEEHLHNKLKAAGLKLKPSKCDLFKQQINYLGYVVSKERGLYLTLKKSRLSQSGLRPLL